MLLALLVTAGAYQVGTLPAPPPLKSGSFSCRVFDRNGQQFQLSGELGNWREYKNFEGLAEIRVDAPQGSDLSFRGDVLLRPLRGELSAYDQTTKAGFSGVMDIGHGREGKIMVSRSIGGKQVHFVGFCDTQFSISPRDLPQ